MCSQDVDHVQLEGNRLLQGVIGNLACLSQPGIAQDFLGAAGRDQHVNTR